MATASTVWKRNGKRCKRKEKKSQNSWGEKEREEEQPEENQPKAFCE